MNIGLGIAIVALLVAALSAIYAGRQASTATGALMHQVLVDILFEYRSVEMLVAIRSLRRFYNDHKEHLEEAYNGIRRTEEIEIAKLEPEQRIERERITLHHQRRFVEIFYSLLAGLYELQVITGKTLYTYWTKKDLEIIPLIILPIRRALSKRFGTDPSEEDARLKRLYDDCPGGNAT